MTLVMNRGGKHHRKRKLFVLGLDGATWTVLLPLIKKGYMPTLKRMIEKGAWGNLQSTIPPITGPAWTSFATGKNPNKTGVYDFLVRDINSYHLKPICSSTFKNKSFWDFLSFMGYKVGVVCFPMLYPPYPVNGFMISGIGSPKHANIFYPNDLKHEIQDIVDNYETQVDYHSVRYNDNELFLRDLINFFDKQKKVIKYLMSSKNWDLFLYVFSAVDWIQHLMWRHIDEDHPFYDTTMSPHLKEKFNEFFFKIDLFIGEILDILGKDANIIILSDHGFGIQDQRFCLARWLEDEGYLVRIRISRARAKNKIFRVLTYLYEKFKLAKVVSYSVEQRAGQSLKMKVVDVIDYRKSKAFCLGHTIPFGAIYINLRGRDPQGIVSEEEYMSIKKEISNKLNNLPNKIDGIQEVIVFSPYTRNQECRGIPDLIFAVNDWRCVILEDAFDEPIFVERPFSERHTGSHRVEGIFLAYGPDINEGIKLTNAKIIDVAPTILHIFSVPIRDDIDGRILNEIFKPESWFAKTKPEYVHLNYF